jgi:hypothetical protein
VALPTSWSHTVAVGVVDARRNGELVDELQFAHRVDPGHRLQHPAPYCAQQRRKVVEVARHTL